MRVLVVEDEIKTAEYLQQGLSESGYVVDIVHNGVDALHLFNTNVYSLVLLDVNLPGIDGWDLLETIRKTSRVRIIMLTARGRINDKLKGLDGGADDYLVKPFEFPELLARIRAVLRRRVPESAGGAVKVGDLQLDADTYRVSWQEKPLKIGPTEFKLLQYMMRHPERVHTRGMLLDKVWGDHVYIEERTVDVHVKRLRESLGDAGSMIETVRGAGYRLTAAPAV